MKARTTVIDVSSEINCNENLSTVIESGGHNSERPLDDNGRLSDGWMTLQNGEHVVQTGNRFLRSIQVILYQ
ncbi:hypothetical protein Smp_128040 [Schistosoma mansoni]|uniref:DUF1080 domain-containing protein n=1 Tax=Schistosoma mansoni TaxID=6183 RepID=G4LYE0_SCHMA|nr:hypothetical protein Smp_128040 [Schistosoma mansoni]|eukprot:XP_018646277.1 hypothetical protein Smp_128040 [Schistosoma mansoni]